MQCMNLLKVAELIDGLKNLGCKRATGEDQTVCVMSDSFNALGNAEDLQASGDLPHVEVVKVCDHQLTECTAGHLRAQKETMS